MSDAGTEAILHQLDVAYRELREARERLSTLLPDSATRPGDSGTKRVDFVVGLEKDSEASGADERRINADAWDQAQKALLQAYSKVEEAHRALRSLKESQG